MRQHQKAKVLVYLFGSLGDTIVAIPALRAARRHFRDAEMVLLQNVETNEKVVSASEVIPEDLVDRYLSYDSEAGAAGKVAAFYRLWRELRRNKFQAAVYLVISERPALSVKRDRLFFRACGIRRLIGFRAFTKEELYPFNSQLNHPAMTDNEAVRKLKRLEADGVEISPEDLRQPLLVFKPAEVEAMKNWLAERRRKPDARLVAVAPGCKTEANVWSLENFIEIGRRLIVEGCEPLVVGGRAERDAGERMIAAWGAGINAAGEFSVRESGAILSLCDFYVGLDTGTTHLAAASGAACFALYGERNNPGQWYPLGNRHEIVFHAVACAGCRAFVCPMPGHPCMNGITVEAVWENLRRFMHGVPPLSNELASIKLSEV